MASTARTRQFTDAQELVLAHRVRAELVRAREARGLLQDEASRLAGIGLGALSRIETGRQVPSLVHLYRLARAYRCSPKGLLP